MDENCVNKTMKLLSQQDYSTIYNKEVIDILNDIAEARPFTVTLETAMYIFMSGYIYRREMEDYFD